MNRKWKSWLLVVLLSVTGVLVAGCSSEKSDKGKETEVSAAIKKSNRQASVAKDMFELEKNGVKMTITYEHKGDKVLKQKTYSIVSYAALKVDSKEEAEENYSFMVDEYDVAGVTYEVEYQEKQLIEQVEVDYEIADIKEVMAMMGTMTDTESGDQVVNYISFKQSKQLLLDQGYTEK